MINIKAFKYRLYPTKKQQKSLEETLYICRTLYNHGLQHRIKSYKESRTSLSYANQNDILLKNKHEFELNVHSQVLQNTLKRLETSFANFFRKIKEKKAGKKIKAGFPRFKGRNRYNSFCYPQSGFRLTNNKRITLSKIGDVKLKYSRPIKGQIKTCRIIRDADQWFVILTCKHEISEPLKSLNPCVGIDVGIKTFAFLSDGTSYENPRHFLKSQKKLSKVQRKHSRRVLGSKNRNKQRIKLSRAHRVIKNQRDDFLHKLSRELVEHYGSIVFEKLNIKNMVRNHKLAKHISDCSWGKLIEYTTYKAEEVSHRHPRHQMAYKCPIQHLPSSPLPEDAYSMKTRQELPWSLLDALVWWIKEDRLVQNGWLLADVVG